MEGGVAARGQLRFGGDKGEDCKTSKLKEKCASDQRNTTRNKESDQLRNGGGGAPQTPVLGRSREAAGESREIQGATVQGFRGLRLWKGTLRPPWQWEELVTWNEMGEAGLKGSGTGGQRSRGAGYGMLWQCCPLVAVECSALRKEHSGQLGALFVSSHVLSTGRGSGCRAPETSLTCPNSQRPWFPTARQ